MFGMDDPAPGVDLLPPDLTALPLEAAVDLHHLVGDVRSAGTQWLLLLRPSRPGFDVDPDPLRFVVGEREKEPLALRSGQIRTTLHRSTR